MKQTLIRLLTVFMLLAVLCVGLTSCGASDPFDVYWQYLNATDMKSDMCMLSQVSMVGVEAKMDETTGTQQLQWSAYAAGNSYMYELDVLVSEVDEKYDFLYLCIELTTGKPVYRAEGHVAAAEFDGDGILTFDAYSGLAINEYNDQITATGLMSTLVEGMDTLLAKVEMSSDDMGFTAMSSDAAVDADDSEKEDLGGAFSPARWLYAGQMTLLGMGMVFLVLAILWAVLGIFKVCLYHPDADTKKEEPQAPTVAPTPAPVPAQPSEMDDGVLLAVITAAVAAAMAEEGNTASGFRVVSFKRTTTHSGPWNG